MTLALQGIKVLDLSRLAPGPYCTMMLADLGADVLRVEEPPPQEGRRAVTWPPSLQQEQMANLTTLNRNKRSLVLNLKSDRGREVFYRLAETADVLVEEFRPGVVKRLGVDFETVSRLNPRLIYCSITGYGQDGPYRNLVGHDINYISMAGALGMLGPRDGPPAIPMNFLADFAGGGMLATVGILAALVARGQTGRGQFVDVAMTDGVVYLLAAVTSHYFINGVVPLPGETILNGGAPYYNCYRTRDNGYISVGCMEPWFWANLCRALGREDLIPYQHAEGEKRKEIFDALQGIFLTKTRDEWFEALRDLDICVGKVYRLDEVFSDPQVLHRNMMVEVETARGDKVRQVGMPLKLSATPGQLRYPAPQPGQHTDTILLELGYDDEKIRRLRKEGVVQ